MIETPSVAVPIPIPLPNNTNNSDNREMKCSYNTFDPSSSSPHENYFLKKLIKRIDSFDKMTIENQDSLLTSDLSIKSPNEVKK